jgi:anti-anti-sigma factor
MHPVRPTRRYPTRPHESLTVTVTIRDNHIAVYANGHLDRSTGSLLAAVVEHEIRRGYRHISVNLDQIGSIDEAGLLALRQAHRAVHACGGASTCMELIPAAWPTQRRHLDVDTCDCYRLSIPS